MEIEQYKIGDWVVRTKDYSTYTLYKKGRILQIQSFDSNNLHFKAYQDEKQHYLSSVRHASQSEIMQFLEKHPDYIDVHNTQKQYELWI